MNRRDIVIGIILLGILAAVIYFVRKPTQTLPEVTPTPRSSEEIEGDIEGAFSINIPDDVEKATLQGQGDASAIATRDIQDGTSEINVLADLPDPDEGSFYQVWIASANEQKLIGTMRQAKGGYLLESTLSGDYSDYSKVTISRETVDDQTLEELVLEGSF